MNHDDLGLRFERSVDRTGEHHLWLGARDAARGTGRIKVAGRNKTAHRVAWELEHGPLPDGSKVFACSAEPACVRLDHLRCETEPAAVLLDGPSARSTTEARGRSRKGSGSMRKTSPGVWKLCVVARDSGGKPRRLYKTVRARSASQAAQALASFVAEVRSQAVHAPAELANLNMDAAVAQFLAEHLRDERGREEKTIRDYAALHNLWFAPEIGHQLVRDVNRASLDRAFGRMRLAGLSRSRLNQAKSVYVPFFKWAKHRGLVLTNPLTDFELPTSTYVSSERTPPEVDELCLLLGEAVIVVPDIAPVLVLGAVTGMRRGELVGLRRSRIRWRDQRITVDSAIDGKRVKSTKTRKERSFHIDEATSAMLARVCEQQDLLVAEAGGALVLDPFVFSLTIDGSQPMPPDYLTKRVALLKEHLGIEEKAPETIAREEEALRLSRRAPVPRPPGKTGPTPKGGVSLRDIGAHFERSERWAALAIAAATRREEKQTRDEPLDFDGSILALRKFTSSELLDAGFNISMVAARQGHGPQVLAKHYAKSRRSADRKAAEHLGRMIHGTHGDARDAG